jgi:hypothetical protein
MSNQIEKDREWLNTLASGVFKCLGHDINDKLRDIASRLGKLDGLCVRLKHSLAGTSSYAERSICDKHIGKAARKRWYDNMELITEADNFLFDEPKPETPAQKYERITGDDGRITRAGVLTWEEDYVEWLEADKPNDWPRRK